MPAPVIAAAAAPSMGAMLGAAGITAGAGLLGNLAQQRQAAKIAAKEAEERRYAEAQKRLAELFQMKQQAGQEHTAGQRNAFQSLMNSYANVLS